MHIPSASLVSLVRFAVLAAGVCASTVAPAQAPAQPPAQQKWHVPLQAEGKTVKLSDHVYLIPDFKVGMVPNVGIIVGTKGALVIDPGMGLRNGQVVLREVQKVMKGGEIYIVNTHFHPEHATGDVAFPPGTKLLRANAQQQDVEEMGMKWVSTFASRSPEIADLLKEVSFRAPDELFEKEKVIDLGGVRVRIIRMGPGHTRGDTVTFVEGDRVLFSGDLAMKDLFPAFATPQSRSQSWLASLDEMERLKPRIVVGAHYDVADATVISDYRGYLTALRSRVGELKKEGKSAEETAEIVRGEMAKKYPAWQQPIRANAAAMVVYRELP
jgi:glyoxylase-like metal-dependent hydrolase (beta-lactamase superfamily II)